jgi:hypothetical protein
MADETCRLCELDSDPAPLYADPPAESIPYRTLADAVAEELYSATR